MKSRLERVSGALKDRDGWTSDGTIHEFAGGRDCAVCGKTVYNAVVLVRTSGPAKGAEMYVGRTCALNALCYATGGLREDPDQKGTNAKN